MNQHKKSIKDQQLKEITQTFLFIEKAISTEMGCWGYKIVPEQDMSSQSKLTIRHAGTQNYPTFTCLETKVSDSEQVIIQAPQTSFRIAGLRLSRMRRQHFPIVMKPYQTELDKDQENHLIDYAQTMLTRCKKKATKPSFREAVGSYISQKLLFGG